MAALGAEARAALLGRRGDPEAAAAGLAAGVGRAGALDNGLGRTPPMGWSSWNRFQCGVSEGLIRAQAEALVASGLRDAGYAYLNVDDCWAVRLSREGQLVEDPSAFPDGLGALVNRVHSRGPMGVDGLTMTTGQPSCAVSSLIRSSARYFDCL